MRVNVLKLGVILSILFIGCKKDDAGAPPPSPPNAPTAEDKLKDSVLLYTRDIYLWYKNIPANFNARSHKDPDAIMQAIRPYSNETGFANPVDRWSFAVTKAEWDGISSGFSGDFGMNVFFRAEGDLRVSHVEPESPAGKAGIRRGWRVKTINGNSNIVTTNAQFIVDAVYYSAATNFVFEKPTGDEVALTLNAAGYQSHPVYLDTIYNNGGKKTGYMVFTSFLGDTTEMFQHFDRIFNRFQTENVQDVIIDLRYNGGGYVSVQNTLANWLVPNAGNNGIMEVQKFNDKYSSFDETIRFSKKGSLNLNRLFVIVSQQTASASELLINSLKPYMNVQLVGPSRTHGKPVGYFAIGVGDWYIFPVSFRTVNKNGEGNYFDGMSLNHQVADGLDKEWGDENESCLKSVLHFINAGSYARADLLMQAEPESRIGAVFSANSSLGEPLFKGAISNRNLPR